MVPQYFILQCFLNISPTVGDHSAPSCICLGNMFFSFKAQLGGSLFHEASSDIRSKKCAPASWSCCSLSAHPSHDPLLHLSVYMTFSFITLCQPKFPKPYSDLNTNVIFSEFPWPLQEALPPLPVILYYPILPVSFRMPFTIRDCLILVFGRSHLI